MVKQSHKKSRRQKRRSHKRITKKMFGGDFSQEENQQLLGLGFTQDDIQVLSNTGVGLNIIQMSLNQVNPATGEPFTPKELIQSVNEVNEEMENFDEGAAVPNQENGVAGINGVDGVADVNHFEEQGPGLNMEDLDPSSPRSVTEMGGKTRKARKGRKSRKSRKSRKQRGRKQRGRKQRGGMCFGNGVGANNYDPNFSIYNTRELTLFPYRPTN
jgi:hypothetical protein